MISQKSFENDCNSLYLVATPIGNLKDITFRAIEILKMVDVIYSEDTRNSSILLNYYQISKPLKSYHEFNKDVKDNEILKDLDNKLNVALISDAGTLIINDPGYEIVKKAIELGHKVISIPGASAFLNALIVSKIPPRPFLFYGFLSHKKSAKKKELEKLKDLPYTIVFYEAVHRLEETLSLMQEVFGSREFSVARELTKKFEEIYWGNLDNVEGIKLKGEFCITVAPGKNIENKVDELTLVIEKIKNGMSKKEAIKEVSVECNIKKQDLYNRFLKIEKK